jgi:hypothetical protein
MTIYAKLETDKDGWTKWISPVMSGYRLGCCDCGLIHEMDFRIVKEDDGSESVEFRARRHERATAAKRRGAKLRDLRYYFQQKWDKEKKDKKLSKRIARRVRAERVGRSSPHLPSPADCHPKRGETK